MMKRVLLSSLCIVTIMLLSGIAYAQQTFLATDDCYTRGGALANTNHNLAWTNPGDALRVRCATADSNKRASYIKFDIAGYTGTVGTATLTIWLDRAINSLAGILTDTSDVWTITDDNWTETTITAANAPPRAQYLYTQVFRRRATADPDTTYSWDVTNFVRTKFAGNKKVSFCLADTNYATHHTDLRIFSRETAGFEPYLTISPATDVHEGSAPSRFALKQNYPNPFNPSTSIQYAVPTAEHVRLVVSDILGRTIALLVNERKNAGEYSAKFDASNVPSGVYFYTLTAGGFRETKRMMLAK